MSSQFILSIPESQWHAMSDDAKDGRLVWLRDDMGNMDIGQWNHGEWNCELGSIEFPSHYSDVSIAGVRKETIQLETAAAGRTLLDEFAMAALTGLLAHERLYVNVAANEAYKYAAEMMRERRTQ